MSGFGLDITVRMLAISHDALALSHYARQLADGLLEHPLLFVSTLIECSDLVTTSILPALDVGNTLPSRALLLERSARLTRNDGFLIGRSFEQSQLLP